MIIYKGSKGHVIRTKYARIRILRMQFSRGSNGYILIVHKIHCNPPPPLPPPKKELK